MSKKYRSEEWEALSNTGKNNVVSLERAPASGEFEIWWWSGLKFEFEIVVQSLLRFSCFYDFLKFSQKEKVKINVEIAIKQRKVNLEW